MFNKFGKVVGVFIGVAATSVLADLTFSAARGTVKCAKELFSSDKSSKTVSK